MNRIAISDTHLCRGAADNFRFDTELARFLNHALEHLKPLELILNGDIFDLIAIEEEGEIDELFKQIKDAHGLVFDAFRKAAKDAHVVLIPGNHDHHLGNSNIADYVRTFLPGVEVASSGVYKTNDKLNGSEVFYYFEHGDAYDPWSSLISPRNGERAKTNAIVKEMMHEFLSKPLKIITSSPSGAAVEALNRTLAKIPLEPHERRLFEERIKPLIHRFKINAAVFWQLMNSFSVHKIKEFGKTYVGIIGAEIAHGEEPFYRASAERIAREAAGNGRRVVSFGHTHNPEVVKVGENAIYANSGTWGHDIKKLEQDRFYEITRGSYLFFNKETLFSNEGILKNFMPPLKRIVLGFDS